MQNSKLSKVNKFSISFFYSSLNGTQGVWFSYAGTHSGRYTKKIITWCLPKPSAPRIFEECLSEFLSLSEFLKKSKLTLEFFWNFAVGYCSDKIITRECDDYHPSISRNWITVKKNAFHKLFLFFAVGSKTFGHKILNNTFNLHL